MDLQDHQQDQRELFEAARSGDLVTVMIMLMADPLVLDKVALIPPASGNTPLHIAAFSRKTEFAKVFLRLKPGSAREVNQAGHTPLHIASALGHHEMVRDLLKVGLDVGLIKDQKGQTPLHHAVMMGRVSVIEVFADLCPNALRSVTDGGDTVLHGAVKNNQFRAMQTLMGIESIDMMMVTYANKDNFTALQLATFSGHTELIKMLRDREQTYHQEPQSTGDGSADDLPQLQGDASVRSDRREIRAKAAANADDRSKTGIQVITNEEDPKFDTQDDIPDDRKFQLIVGEQILGPTLETPNVTVLRKIVIQAIFRLCFWALKRAYRFDEDTLQVVAVLLVTVSYQGAFTPPPAIWKDGMKLDYRCMIHPKSSLHSPPAGHCPTPSYLFFVLFNSSGFFCSVLLLLLHKRGTAAQALLAWSLIALIVSYIILFFAASPDWISCLTTVGCLVILLIVIYNLNSFMYRPIFRSPRSPGKRTTS